ncbi:hypothetical protein CUT44_30170 [Streptomyces carminius]|uniref:Uncharacterized protein n=1 Tax=Streptomyces carminius TaxID=2665496 RepID=A0A2M8LRB2_9ACTN|nr:hypothetical protein [Streptomyces carminius]PJE94482.1 hypothetical protein CUT44_30170 [Streptomyces carminius]
MPSEDGPLAAVTASPRVEYRQFALCDVNEAGADGGLRPGRIVHPGPHGVTLTCGGNDFYPEVRVELWAGAPPGEDAGDWDAVETAAFTSPHGRVGVRSWDGGMASPELDLGAPGTYRLRAYCRGRAAAATRVGRELYYRGVEEWLLRLWPVGAE